MHEQPYVQWMQLALAQARMALEAGDVPVGAVVIDAGGKVLAMSPNRRESGHDPVGHAELLALREAGRVQGSWRLSGCTVVVTLEPCPMCAGALVLARIARVVFATPDPKAGAAGSVLSITDHPALNHRVEVVAGVLADESRALLKTFFRERRQRGMITNRRGV
jgi:tRNA(adenine34) deaminase